MTILDALTWGTEKIRGTVHEKKTKEHIPNYDAQTLLAHALGVRTSFLFAHGNDPLSESAWDTFRNMILRRATHEPISHILQSAIFYGRSFFVNRHVLTPRPETEELMEIILQETPNISTYIDVGTGSGAIATTLALETKKSVYATDISSQALTVAKWNAQQLNAKVMFLEGNLINPVPEQVKKQPNVTYIANLPYIPISARREMDPDVLQYEPHNALFSGADGLELSTRLLHQLPIHTPLSLFMELDCSNVHVLAKIAQEVFPKAKIEVIQDLGKRPRFLKLIQD